MTMASRFIRAVAVVAGLGLAGAAGANAIGNAPVTYMPALAFAFRDDSELQLRAVDLSFQAERRFPDARKASEIARQALREEPLNSRPLRILAYAEPGGAQSKRGQTLVELAERVSRRDGLTELALMETAVRRGDAKTALHHFDVMLRAHPQGQEAVFPLLSRALVAPEIREEITRHLIARSPWLRDFITFASTTGQEPGLTAEFVLAAGGKISRDDVDVVAPALLTRLVEAREFDRAVRLLALMGGDRAIVTKGTITTRSADPRFGYLAWQTVSEGNRSANLTGADKQGKEGLAIYGSSGAAGEVASKILALPAGRHILSQRIDLRSGAPVDTAQWQLLCASVNGAAPFWTSENLVTSRSNGSKQSFSVPAGCRYQKLVLFVRAASQGQGIDLTVEEFAID